MSMSQLLNYHHFLKTTFDHLTYILKKIFQKNKLQKGKADLLETNWQD